MRSAPSHTWDVGPIREVGPMIPGGHPLVGRGIKLKSVLCAFRSKRRASKLDLQKLAGILAHCATIIRAGRTFSRRVINLCNSIAERYDTTQLSAEFHADLNWWLSFAEIFHGVSKAIRVSDTNVFAYTLIGGSRIL